MNHNPDLPDLERRQLITSLIEFRTEWETAVDGAGLMDVQVPVGLILADLIDLVGLSQCEKQSILGTTLFETVYELTEA